MQSVKTRERETDYRVAIIPVDRVRKSRFGIRTGFGELGDLAKSIAEKGLIHPLIVRPIENSCYEVVTGSRRLEACRLLGITEISASVINLDDKSAFEFILTENIQHQTLTPLEEAKAFYLYVGPKQRNCYSYGKVSELATNIGKSQEYVSSRLGMLRLPERVLNQLFAQKYFTVSHAEGLASLSERPEAVEELTILFSSGKISVRQLERAIPMIKSGLDTKRAIELARIESAFKLDPESQNSKDNVVRLMKKTNLLLKSVLSYIDELSSDLESDDEVYKWWVNNVRLKVHDAINGVIACQRLRNGKCSAR